jgi:hypothetical protein
MPDTILYFDPTKNRITAVYTPQSHEITKSEVPALVRKGAEVDQSARDLNDLMRRAGQ